MPFVFRGSISSRIRPLDCSSIPIGCVCVIVIRARSDKTEEEEEEDEEEGGV